MQPADFMFGRTLGEGAYARVVHAQLKASGTHYAVKIMEKRHIKRENKVNLSALANECCRAAGWGPGLQCGEARD